jgi:outer membrane protein assembly factor BamD (BamD/ComL family)
MKFQKVLVLLFTILLVTACSNKNDEDYFHEAQKHLARQEYQQAVDSFTSILENFPESKYAARAALEIAKLYHGMAIPSVPKNEAFLIAVKYYKICNSLDQNSDIGKNALFMAAFVEANELKEFDKARELYNEFIEKYPDDPMVPSAKIEIQTLGIEPEKIIEGKIKGGNAK